MTPAGNRPELRRIGERALAEVLRGFQTRPIVGNSAAPSPLADAPDQITSAVCLTGQRLSGCVRLQLPQAFVAHAVRLLTGLDGAAGDTQSVLDDAAGELANMVAGRVAAQLVAEGYTCTLGTPSVSRGAPCPLNVQPGVDHAHTELWCDSHRLLLELQCRYAVRCDRES